jgi:hypothetical protein
VKTYLHVHAELPTQVHGVVNKIVVAQKYPFWGPRRALLGEDKQVDCIIYKNHCVTLKCTELSLSKIKRKIVFHEFHCFTVHFSSLRLKVQLMHLFVIKH